MLSFVTVAKDLWRCLVFFLGKGVRDARDVVTFGYIGQCSDIPVEGGLIVRREDEQVFFGCLFHAGVAIIDHLNQ